MELLQTIYDHSPIPIQHTMTTLSGYQRNRSRYGKLYWQHRQFLADFDTWNLADKLNYQAAELRDFIRHATDHSPFYRDLYANVDLDSVRTPEDLRLLPVVEKEDLRANASSIYTVGRHGAVEGHTGGTTGKSLVVLMTRDDMMKRMAMLDHFKARVGFEHRQMRRATFSGKHIVPPSQDRPVFWRYNRACRQMLYSTFDITEANLHHYVRSLNDFKPHALDGFFTSMLEVANFIERHRIELKFSPVAIFPTSETVTPSGRDTLERAFRSKVYDQYASSEGAPFVTECRHNSMHVELASGVFEHFSGADNEIIVTSFTTHGTPLIRYRIGDSMVFEEPTTCPCGIQSPLMHSIEGRRDDYLLRSDGAKVNAGNVANLFKNMPNSLVKAQLIQESVGEVTILLVVDEARYRHEDDVLLRDEAHHKFGESTRITIRHVEDIPRERSGKHRLIKNVFAASSDD